jgi:hypothetical protein
MQKLQAVIGGVPHNRIVTGNHDQREPKRFGVFCQRSARLASHRGVDNDCVNVVVFQDTTHRLAIGDATHPIAAILKNGCNRIAYAAIGINDQYVLVLTHGLRPEPLVLWPKPPVPIGISVAISSVRRPPSVDLVAWIRRY